MRFASIAIIILVLMTGCGKPPPPKVPQTLSQANQTFLKLCKEESKLEPLITPLENTLYIYLPVEHSILDLKANADGPETSDTPKEKPIINFFDGYFDGNNFTFNYDIGPIPVRPRMSTSRIDSSSSAARVLPDFSLKVVGKETVKVVPFPF